MECILPSHLFAFLNGVRRFPHRASVVRGVWHVSLNLLSHLDNCTIFTAWVSRFFPLFFPVTYWLFPKELILRQMCLLTGNTGLKFYFILWVSWFFLSPFFWPVIMNVKRKIINFSKKSLFWDPYTFVFMCKRENSSLIQTYL